MESVLALRTFFFSKWGIPMPNEIEILIQDDTAVISWNDETIQEIAAEIGQPEFPEPRPCG
jgi:hypothetical protein